MTLSKQADGLSRPDSSNQPTGLQMRANAPRAVVFAKCNEAAGTTRAPYPVGRTQTDGLCKSAYRAAAARTQRARTAHGTHSYADWPSPPPAPTPGGAARCTRTLLSGFPRKSLFSSRSAFLVVRLAVTTMGTFQSHFWKACWPLGVDANSAVVSICPCISLGAERRSRSPACHQGRCRRGPCD